MATYSGGIILSAASCLAIILVSHAIADIGLGSGSVCVALGRRRGLSSMPLFLTRLRTRRRQAAVRNGSWPEAWRWGSSG